MHDAFKVHVLYRVSKKKRKVFNEPLNNSDIFNFQNLVFSGCQYPNLDSDLQIFHFSSLLVEISSTESDTLT